MTPVLTSLLSFLLLYKYIALFVIVFASSIIVPIPSNALVLAAGGFASLGYFNIGISFAVATSASVLGDSVDYFLARYYGPRIFNLFKINKHYYFERLEHGVRENARLTIFVTRFVGPLDQLVSLFAGSIRVSFGTFMLYDFLGNGTATAIVLYLGFIAGSYWQNLSGVVDTAGEILLVAILIFLIVRIFFRKRHTPATEEIQK